MPYQHSLGLVAGLLAACCWAIAAVVFRRLGVTLHPLVLNLYKGLISGVALLLVLAAGSGVLHPVPTSPFLLLLLSGGIGIGIGDTAFFASLNRLGERQTVLVAETTAPLVTILLALLLFGELISLPAMIGIVIILLGVYLVVTVRSGQAVPTQRQTSTGIAYALLAACCQAVGGVMSKAAFRQGEIDPVWSALVRILGGFILVLILIPLFRQSFLPAVARNRKVILFVVVAALIGTFGGIVFQQIAYKFTYTGLAQTLLATSSIFVLFIALLRGEKTPRRAWLGALAAVTGAGLPFWF